MREGANYIKPENHIKNFEETYPQLASSFKEIQLQQYELFAKKMLSYGIGNISLGTDLSQEEDKHLSLTSIWVRVNDKVNRLKNLVVKKRDNTIEDESIIDTWKDLCNYAIIAQMVTFNSWK